ncbi:MAG: hypothetical protein L3J28_11135 [Candidatus Polarisedimenticolaceae bacterium]|nr:hypothetical protein [Candidatus Polarisedimenticolaceae bacterium]
MATFRERGDKFEFKVTRKRVLPAPGYVYLTFDSEEEGIAYCARLEKLLDNGIVPEELKTSGGELIYLTDVIRKYLKSSAHSDPDSRLLGVQCDRIGGVRVSEICYSWAERWIAGMKRHRKLTPITIRHHVGALARCLDWLYRKDKIDVVNLFVTPQLSRFFHS